MHTQWRLQRRERQQHTAQWQARVRLCFRTITRAPSRSDLQLFSHDRPFAGSGTRLLTRRVMTSAASRVRWRVCVAMYRVCRWLKSYSILDTRLVYDRRRPMVAIHSFSNHQVMTNNQHCHYPQTTLSLPTNHSSSQGGRIAHGGIPTTSPAVKTTIALSRR